MRQISLVQQYIMRGLCEQEINTRSLSCDGTDTWQHGNSLVNYMKLVRAIKHSYFTLVLVNLKRANTIKENVVIF
jgi:hypothetical protein